MPKAEPQKRGRKKNDPNMDPKERRMRQMSRALGVDIAQVARMLEAQEAAASGGGGASSSDAAQLASVYASSDAAAKGTEDASSSPPNDANLKTDTSAPAAAAASAVDTSSDMGGASSGKSPATTAGTVAFCGGTDWETLGKSKTTGECLSSPHILSFPTRIASVHSGPSACHSIAVDVSGNAYIWGRNDLGQCGLNHRKVQNTPTKLKLDGPVVSASCGRAHTGIVTRGGSLFMFGCGTSGQLGIGRLVTDKNPILTPTRVYLHGAEPAAVSCGGDFTMVLSTDGRIFAFGHPEYGQLGNGTNGEYFISGNKLSHNFVIHPTPIAEFLSKDNKHKVQDVFPDVRFSKIFCGKNHTVALERAPGNRVFSWGFGGYGRLGHNSQDDEYVPRQITMFDRMTHLTMEHISAGGTCSLALASTGHLFYWGKLPNAQRGEATMYPKLVEDLGNWKVRCMAASHQCVMVGAEMSTVGWGAAIACELGYGDGADIPKTSRAPKKVDALEGAIITSVAMGLAHTLFIIRDSEKEDAALIKKLPSC